MRILKRLGVVLALILCFTSSVLHAQELPPEWTFPGAWESWSFFDVTNWSSDKGFPALSFTNIYGVQRGDINTEYAAAVDTTNSSPARLQYKMVETGETTNLTIGLGAVTFWIAPNSWASASTNGTGPGAWAELFSVGQWTTNASYGYWGLSIDAGATNIYFAAQNSTGSNAVYLSAPIEWNTNEWHFVALSYSTTNTALYLDGLLATNGPGLTVLPGTNAITNGFFIGSDSIGFEQSRCMFDDVYTFPNPISADDAEGIYNSQFYDFFLNPYNSLGQIYNNPDPFYTNTSSLMVNIASISNNLANLLMMNTSPDVLYEVQGKTNLSQTNWISEGFVDGSELTNWTPATVSGLLPGNLFLRTRSWQDSTGTGIPDWWWYQYFGQITNVDAFASAAGDGYSNLQKFQMGLNPTNYYNTNPPAGFFGAVVNNTNAVIVWNMSPGPVTNYLVQRGILDPNTGNYTYTSFILSSNATSFQDLDAITNDNAQNNIYNLEALYVGGCVTATDTWYVANYQQGILGPPYGPPVASNVWAYPDATGTNLLISWTAAQGSPTNYTVERGIFDSTAYTYNYYPFTEIGTNTNATQVIGEFSNSTNWENLYAVVAGFPGGILSVPSVSAINAGPPSGPAAPMNFYGYMDSTGTNAWLNWNLSSNAVGYIIYRGAWNLFVGAYSYMEVAAVGTGTNSFEIMGANDAAGDYSGNVYTVVAVYSGGVLSMSAAPWEVGAGSAAPGAFSAHLDSTGTNVFLAWSTPTAGATGYILSRSGDGGSSFSEIAQVGSTASTYEDTNGVAASGSGVSSLVYKIQATYPHGGLSMSVTARVASTPPTPTGLIAGVDSTGTNVVLSWLPALGASGYTIEQGTYDTLTGGYTYSVIATVGAGTTSYTDFGASVNDTDDVFAVRADFTDGDESDLDTSYLNSTSAQTGDNLDIALIHGPSQMELALFSVPNGTAALLVNLVTNDQCGWGGGTNVSFEIPISSFTNGICVLSDSQYPYYTAYYVNVQAVASNGVMGEQRTIESDCEKTIRYPFLDGSQTLKDNLIFAFQGQSAVPYPPPGTNDLNDGQNPDYPNFVWGTEGVGLGLRNGYSFPIPVYAVASFHSELTSGTAPPYLGFYTPVPDLSFLPTGRGLHPWEINVADADWQYQPPAAFCSLDTNSGFEEGGYVSGSGTFVTTSFVPWGFDGSSFVESQTTNACPSMLASASGRGIFTSDPQFPVITNATDTAAHVVSGIQNAYGLPFDGVYLSYYDYGAQEQVTNYFAAGADCPTNLDTTHFWEQYDPPNLQPEFYEFSQSDKFLALQPDTVGTNGGTAVTNLLIASVGDPDFNVSAWLRYHLLNGNSGIYGYVEQYWDKAYKADTNGNPTSEETGILSPYGEFFPTEPGNVALVTRTNIENGLTGTGIVHVISLNVDANHDGTLDFTYKGPDFVSTNKPFRFWANDDVDSGDYGGNDGIPGQLSEIADGSRVYVHQTDVPVPVPQYARAIVDAYAVHGRRDLVDYFPVYVNIGSLFQSAGINPNDSSYQFALSQADGVLRFVYTDLTPTNYMNFLRDTNESGKLADPPAEAFPILPQGVCLDQSFIENIATNNGGIILVEAATNTTQPLVLTIYRGTNQIAQAQLPLSITGVEQMFRSKTMLLRSLPGQLPDRLTDDSVPNEPDTIAKNFVFLHGYNVLPNEARGVASDVFKRLYWSGSHAKFWAVTWEGADTKGSPPFYNKLTPNYHTNVVDAFLTAPMLANFITTLTNSGPVVAAAHSLGNMVTLSAISDWNAPISQYFMLDAAVAIEAIDPTSSDDAMIPSAWTGYSNRLYAANWYQLFPTNDARSTLTWRNRLGNLRNTDIYNCYSTGEEVLREDILDPPTDFSAVLTEQLADAAVGGAPFGTFTWYWQEKGKGPCSEDWLIGDSHGGWKFSTYWVDSGGNTLSPAIMNDTSNSILQTQPMFNFPSTANSALLQLDDELLGDVSGVDPSAYAATNRDRILSDAIPAMSLVIGANPVPSFAGDHNIDMMTLENGWAQGRLNTRELNNWHHSDFHDMAYTFTHKLFDQFVTTGNLK